MRFSVGFCSLLLTNSVLYIVSPGTDQSEYLSDMQILETQFRLILQFYELKGGDCVASASSGFVLCLA